MKLLTRPEETDLLLIVVIGWIRKQNGNGFLLNACWHFVTANAAVAGTVSYRNTLIQPWIVGVIHYYIVVCIVGWSRRIGDHYYSLGLRRKSHLRCSASRIALSMSLNRLRRFLPWSLFLVGPCALEYTKLKTADHYWTDPSADELVQRHRIHGAHGRQDSPSKRPALGVGIYCVPASELGHSLLMKTAPWGRYRNLEQHFFFLL